MHDGVLELCQVTARHQQAQRVCLQSMDQQEDVLEEAMSNATNDNNFVLLGWCWVAPGPRPVWLAGHGISE